MIQASVRDPPPHRLGPTNALSRHSYASGIFVAASRFMISTPVTLWSEHGPAASLVHTTGRACIRFDHTSTRQGRQATPAPLLRLRDLASRYAHGQDGTTTHWHTTWAGYQIFYLSTKRGQASLPSRTLQSEWPDWADSNPFDCRTRSRSPLHFFTPTRIPRQGPALSLPAAQRQADGLTPLWVSHINSETVSKSTSRRSRALHRYVTQHTKHTCSTCTARHSLTDWARVYP